MNVLHGMSVTAKKNEVLDILRTNRESHSRIVKEAREGYVKKAEEVLAKRLNEIREGKIVHLFFNLEPPKDYSSVYDTAIKMLEIHTEDTIKLDSQQVQHLIQDDWDWMSNFLQNASNYSNAAVQLANSKGLC